MRGRCSSSLDRVKKQVEREEQMKLYIDIVEKERVAGMASVLTSLQRMGERLQDVVGELKGPGILRDLQDEVRRMEASLKADQQQLVEIRGEVVELKSEVGGGHREVREGLGQIGDRLEVLRVQGIPQLLTDVRTEVAGLRAEKGSDQVADVIRTVSRRHGLGGVWMGLGRALT